MPNSLHILQLKRNKLLSVILKKIYFLIKLNDEFVKFTKLKGFFYNYKYPNLLFLDAENISAFFEVIPTAYFINIRQNSITTDDLAQNIFKKEILTEKDITINIGDKVEFTTGKQKRFAIVKEVLIKEKIAKVNLINSLTNYPFLMQIPLIKLRKIYD